MTASVNPIAASVWRLCDGARTTSQISESLREAFGAQAHAVVSSALAEFVAAGLLETTRGSFAVEIITSWPGLGSLMLGALRARDVYLVAGCAATGSVFLAVGTLVSDAMLALVDPRASE